VRDKGEMAPRILQRTSPTKDRSFIFFRNRGVSIAMEKGASEIKKNCDNAGDAPKWRRDDPDKRNEKTDSK